MAILTAPVVALAGVLIFVSDPGPIFYRPRRAGLKGEQFTLFKLRSMRRLKAGQVASKITAGKQDPRVFAFGHVIRVTKIDELPQFWNVILGQLAVVGPRPEDPAMIAEHYTPYDLETLNVRPGLTSPGSLFASTHGDDLLGTEDTEGDYVEKVMPLRMAIEHVYMSKRSVAYDAWVVWRTVGLIFGTFLRKKEWKAQPEVVEAQTELARREQRVAESAA